MNKIVVKLNYEGVRQLLRSPEMKAVILSHAQNMVSSLGDGYEAKTWYGSKDGRVRAFVGTTTNKSFQKNLEENTLLKAAGGQQND